MSARRDAGGAGASRREVLRLMAAGSGLILLYPLPRARATAQAAAGDATPPYDWEKHYWGYAVDTSKCIGCLACMRGCRAENDVPEDNYRTWVERYRVDAQGKVAVDVAKDEVHGFDPVPGEVVKAFFIPKLCNHCVKSVCSQVCPVGASYHTKDGVVLVDPEVCVGCGYCVQACPYGTRFITPHDHLADKCTLCYHRITRGLLPACVQSCPREARIFGDLKDPKSKINTILRQRRYRVLRPELGTHPKCYYLGLDEEVI